MGFVRGVRGPASVASAGENSALKTFMSPGAKNCDLNIGVNNWARLMP
jgi:hypothetical protein